MNSVISDWLGYSSNPVRPGAEKRWDILKPAVRIRSGDFSTIRMWKNTTPYPITWMGYVRPATINQAMGGEVVFFSSNPIPPVAVAADLLAEHVLSRSAGSKGSSRITVNIIGHHSPNKAREFSGYCCNSNIPFLSVSGQPVVFAAKSDICLVCISDDICRVSLLPRD